MSEMPKPVKLLVLILGLTFVKLAVLLSFYPLLPSPFSQALSTPQDSQSPLSSSPLGYQVGGMIQESTDVLERKDVRTGASPPLYLASALYPQTDGLPARPPQQTNQSGDSCWEPVKQLAASLERQRISLTDKETRLRQESEQLEMLKVALREQLKELTAMQVRISEALKKKADLEEEELKRLARVYEATAPEQSGVLLGRLDAKLAARILARMNGPKAGKVLSFMEPAQATRVSEELAKKE